MTPFARFIARWFPRPLQILALALTYAAMLLGIGLASRHDNARIIYVDVRGG